MAQNDFINCYCFNENCKNSIFNMGTYSVVKLPLSKVLTDNLICEVCGGELVSKPILEIKTQVNDLLDGNTLNMIRCS